MADRSKGGVPAPTPKSQRIEERHSGENSEISPPMNKFSRDYSKNKPDSADDPFGILTGM